MFVFQDVFCVNCVLGGELPALAGCGRRYGAACVWSSFWVFVFRLLVEFELRVFWALAFGGVDGAVWGVGFRGALSLVRCPGDVYYRLQQPHPLGDASCSTAEAAGEH